MTLPAELVGPPRLRPRGTLHPSTLVRRDVEDIFLGLGYEIVDGREVETTRYNFDALNFPEWHPARSPRASLFLDEQTVLRTETSPAQIHKMEERRPPIYMVSIGRVYRRDTIDATHFPIFHQFEGLAIDDGITMADLKGTLLYVMRQLYGPERELRFRTHYFPFTEPSMEPDVSCFNCGGAGCAICKHSGWIEMGGSGMVDPYLYEFVGWGPEEYTGFAFGMGIERTAQLRNGIPGIRPFWENDLRFLRQF
ncbi:MAG: phenylalanine--tRNA ligase subunit alpha [Gaiellaceae bacterium]